MGQGCGTRTADGERRTTDVGGSDEGELMKTSRARTDGRESLGKRDAKNKMEGREIR